MTRPSKQDIHLKALNAAAGVALFTGTIAAGCGQAPNSAFEIPPIVTTPDARVLASDAGAERLDAAIMDARRPAAMPDAGQLDAAAAMDIGLADSGLTTCDPDLQTWEEYTACCEQARWNPERGCSAWGPPAPPSVRSTSEVA